MFFWIENITFCHHYKKILINSSGISKKITTNSIINLINVTIIIVVMVTYRNLLMCMNLFTSYQKETISFQCAMYILVNFPPLEYFQSIVYLQLI